MEGVLRDIPNVLVYIDDLLVHTDTHEKHLQVLDQVLARLHKNHLKINLEMCVFGNKEVSYLGFTLTPDGIIRKDCFQVKSNLLTDFRFTTHMNIMILN